MGGIAHATGQNAASRSNGPSESRQSGLPRTGAFEHVRGHPGWRLAAGLYGAEVGAVRRGRARQGHVKRTLIQSCHYCAPSMGGS